MYTNSLREIIGSSSCLLCVQTACKNPWQLRLLALRASSLQEINGSSGCFDIAQNRSLLHRRQKTQGLMPLLAFLTRIDNGTVGNNVGQNRSLQHHRQSIQRLLPLLANPTSTDDG